MEHTVPATNWHIELERLLQESEEGDTIIVRSKAMQELAEIARIRMCPDKTLVFKVGTFNWRL